MSIKTNGGHSYVAGEPAEDGSVTYTCDTCGDSYVEEAPEHTHIEVEIPAVLPTPTVTGYTAGTKCSECGEIVKAPVEIVVTELDSNHEFRFRAASISLNENISVNYKPAVVSGYNNVYVVFVFDADMNGITEEYVITEYKNIETVSAGQRYVFNFNMTGPEKIANNIAAYCYAETADGFVMNKREAYSIKEYCTSQLSKNDASLTTAISDLLVMCAATQVYMQVNTDALITDVIEAEGYTLTPTTFASIDSSLNVQAITGDRTTGTDWKSGSLVLGASTEMNFKFETDNVEGLQIKVTIGGVDTYYNANELKMDGNRYVVNINYITATQFNETVTAVFLRDGVQVGSTVTYSINSYLYRNYNNSGVSEASRALCKALYNYGVTIANYFN